MLIDKQRMLSPGRESGIALLEALLALVIAVAGLLAIAGFNARMAGMNMDNRFSAAASLAAQARLEKLRNLDFDALTNGTQSVQFQGPGFSVGRTFQVETCWTVTSIRSDAAGKSVLALVTVAASRVGACSTDPAAAPRPAARLTTLIARSDPRRAAEKIASNAAADGNGQIVKLNSEQIKKLEGAPRTPSGFAVVTNLDGYSGIADPATGQMLTGNGSKPLLFATISGNIIYDGVRDRNAFNRLLIRAEGNAICRKFYPLSESDPSSSPPTLSDGSGPKLTYIQYSCVVADGWRRSISVFSGEFDQTTNLATDKTCVGNQALQPSSSDEYSGIDVLDSPGRQYLGVKSRTNNVDGTQTVVFEGMRGTDAGGNAKVGSVCAPVVGTPPAGDCWADVTARGWVPGGHHFFITPATNEFCATRMDQLLEIDLSNAGRGGAVQSSYYNYLFRNPHKVFCTNDKNYTIGLPPITSVDPQTTLEDCYSYTNLSGFILPSSASTIVANDIIMSATSSFLNDCKPMGAFGPAGGGYACGFPEDTPAMRLSLAMKDTHPPLVFSPGATGASAGPGVTPVSLKHDYTNYNFTFSPSGGTCADNSVQWAAGGNSCSGAITAKPNGTTGEVVNASGVNIGSASFTCSGTTWTLQTDPAPTCTPPVSTLKCPAGVSRSWGGGNCQGQTTQEVVDGGVGIVTNSVSSYTGTASFKCNGSTWAADPESGATCTALQTCTANISGRVGTGNSVRNATVSLSINGGVGINCPVTKTGTGSNLVADYTCPAQTNTSTPTTVSVTRSNPAGGPISLSLTGVDCTKSNVNF